MSHRERERGCVKRKTTVERRSVHDSDTGSTLNGFNDWANLSIPSRQFGDSASSGINAVDHPNPTIDELIALEDEVNTTDLSVAISDTPDPVAAGTPLPTR